MNATPNPVLLSTENFAARASLALLVDLKAVKLLRHANPHVDLVRIHVKRETPHSRAPYFAARATAEHAGLDHVAHAEGSEPEAAVVAVIGKLERALTAAARARKHLLHRTRAVELEADLPVLVELV